MVIPFPEPPHDADDALRRQRLEHDDTLIEPWHLPHVDAALGCAGACQQGRRACDCQRAQPLVVPPLDPIDAEPQIDHRLRARLWRGYVLLVLAAVAAAGWWLQGVAP